MLVEEGSGYRVIAVEQDRRAEIKTFVLQMMEELYPKGTYYENPRDLACFDDFYLRPANARFFIAEAADGGIVGTAAIRPYDGRFAEMRPFLGDGPVCEVAKFYVHPASRRQGIGSRLYDLAEQFAREAGYCESYLHTSLFLPGGYGFWKSCGYREQYWESDDVVHMRKGFL